MSESLEKDTRDARAAQGRAAREGSQTAKQRDAEVLPLLERIRRNSSQDEFGQQITISMTRKQRTA